MKPIAFTSLCAGLLLAATASAGSNPSLIGFDWTVELCKQQNSSEDCKDHRQMMPNDRFGVHGDDDGYRLKIELQKPPMDIEIPVEMQDLCKKDCPNDNPPHMVFSFKDHDGSGGIATKTMHVTLLHSGGPPADPRSCAAQLKSLSKGKIGKTERDQQCQLKSLVHWKLSGPGTAEDESGSDVGRTLGPPGDGHGTGSGGTGEG